MSTFVSVEGTVTDIIPLSIGIGTQDECCIMIMSVRGTNGNTVDFVVDSDTYFIDNANIRRGESIIAFYDSDVPTITIFPPQYRAVVVSRLMSNRFVAVTSFNRFMVSSDGTMRLNISTATRIIMRNGQSFRCDIADKNVAVVYSVSTRSFPAMITPSEIIVLCR